MIYATIHSLKFVVFSFFIVISFFVLSAHSAHAYFTTSQSAIALNNHTVLFLIDYTFGTNKYGITMPIMAINSTLKHTDSVSFSILDKESKAVAGKTTSIVLSKASLTEEMYSVPKKVAQKFTLAVFFTPEPYELDKEYRLQVTHLPFRFDGNQQLQLNPSELERYTTKLISL